MFASEVLLIISNGLIIVWAVLLLFVFVFIRRIKKQYNNILRTAKENPPRGAKLGFKPAIDRTPTTTSSSDQTATHQPSQPETSSTQEQQQEVVAGTSQAKANNEEKTQQTNEEKTQQSMESKSEVSSTQKSTTENRNL